MEALDSQEYQEVQGGSVFSFVSGLLIGAVAVRTYDAYEQYSKGDKEIEEYLRELFS